MMKDADFKADLDRQRLTLEPKFHEEAMAIVNVIAGSPPDIIAAAKKVMTD